MIKASSVLVNVNPSIGQLMKIRSQWKEIAGDVIASHTIPVRLRNKNLLILCDSPAWIQQVGLLVSELRESIERHLKIKIKKIDAKFSMVKETPRPGPLRPERRIIDQEMDASLVEKIKDPDLKHAVKKFIEATRRENG